MLNKEEMYYLLYIFIDGIYSSNGSDLLRVSLEVTTIARDDSLLREKGVKHCVHEMQVGKQN